MMRNLLQWALIFFKGLPAHIHLPVHAWINGFQCCELASFSNAKKQMGENEGVNMVKRGKYKE